MKLRSIVSVCAMALATAAFADVTDYTDGKVCGWMRVDSTLAITAVGVPWVAVSNTAVNVAVVDYVMADNLTKGDSTTGDKLYLYDNSSNTWKAYYLDTNGKWKGFSTSKTIGKANVTIPAGSDTDLIARGQALYLERSSPTNLDGTAKSFYLYGAVGAEVASSTLTANKTYLLASPKVEVFNLNASGKITGAETGDTITVPLAGGQSKLFTWDGSKWGFQEERLPKSGDLGYDIWLDKDTKYLFRNTEDCTIPLGTGFWYTTSSTGSSRAINW